MKIKNWLKINNKIKLLFDSFYAYYNSGNGEIGNCKKNSYSYFHELRHKHQDDFTPLNSIAVFLYCFGYYINMIMLLILMTSKEYVICFIVMGIIALPHILIMTILEADAYIFGLVYYLKYLRGVKSN